MSIEHYTDGLVQERRNSIANALQLRLLCTNLSVCGANKWQSINSTMQRVSDTYTYA